MKLSGVLLALLVLSACAAAPAALKSPWSVEVETSGGLAGRGLGSFTVHSDGMVDVVKTDSTKCHFQLTPAELAHIESLLAATKRSEWKSSYAPENQCCDRISYVLTVDEAGSKTQTSWITEPLPMPQDLVALANAIVDSERSVRSMVEERCK